MSLIGKILDWLGMGGPRCPICGEKVTGKKVYCTDRCREAAYRKRKKDAAAG
jgi:predicted nucleic acid-binding Zn ribbon protein